VWGAEHHQDDPQEVKGSGHEVVPEAKDGKNHGKTMGKPWENHGKTMGKPWENGDVLWKITISSGINYNIINGHVH